jgi:hypothetical protein
MATTYEAIATVTVGAGGASNIEFTSIPATFTDLVAKYSLRLDSNPQSAVWCSIQITLNSSTSSFTDRIVYGTGSATGSQSTSNRNLMWVNSSSSTANTFTSGEVYFPNYAGSNNKSFSADATTENNGTDAFAGLNAMLWANTSAITSIKIAPPSGNFVQYSTATLYGIKNS